MEGDHFFPPPPQQQLSAAFAGSESSRAAGVLCSEALFWVSGAASPPQHPWLDLRGTVDVVFNVSAAMVLLLLKLQHASSRATGLCFNI
jgi:hypothetical protein